MMWLHSFQQFREFCQCNDIDIREGGLTEYIKMMVVGYDISGSSCNSTIDKLVVVRVCLNHLEMIIWRDKFYERTIAHPSPETPKQYGNDSDGVHSESDC